MKLIRLTSEKPIFEINFNEDIIIPKGSKIALKNLSIKQFIPFLNINPKRDTIFSTVENENVLGREITLSNQAYYNELSDLYEFMEDLENKLNSVLTLTGRELGMEWRVQRLPNDHITIENRAAIFDFLPVLYDFTGTVTTDIDLGEVKATVRKTDQTNKYYSKYKFTKGSGVFRARINSFVDNDVGDAGFEIGLSNVKPELWEDSNTMTDKQRTYSIIATEGDEAYQFKKDGDAAEPSGTSPLKFASGTLGENDIVEISLSLGVIRGTVYQDDGVKQIFNSTYNQDDDLFPYIIMYGQEEDIVIDDIKQCLSPYETLDEVVPPFANYATYLQAVNPPVQVIRDSTTELTLNKEVSSYLGFNDTILSKVGDEGVVFESDNEFQIYNSNDDSMVIVSDSLKLDSYDSDNLGRLNTLEVVPNLHTDSRYIGYEPNNLNFIDITNTNDITLRNLRFRLLSKDLKLANIANKGVMTVLIKTPKEE